MEEIKKAKDLCERGEYHKSKDYAEKGLGISRKRGDREGEAQGCHVLAWSYYKIKEYENSKKYCDQFQNIAKEVGDKKLEAEAYQFLACYFYRVGDHKKSIENGIKSLSIAEEAGDKELKARAHSVLANSHQMARNLTECGTQSPDIVIGLGDSELEGGACLKIQPHLRETSRNINQGILDEEFDVELNDVVEMVAEQQKTGACEVFAQSYDVMKHNEHLNAGIDLWTTM